MEFTATRTVPTRCGDPHTRRRAAWVILPLLLAMVWMGAHAGGKAAGTEGVSTLWGIDAWDNMQTVGDLSATQESLGAVPQFAGQYLGSDTLTSADVQYLHTSGVSILVIDDPNHVFTDGTADAQQAVVEARSIDVPAGTAIFRDVEASDPITKNYIISYYDAFQGSGYVPGFYENPNGGSDHPFNVQYCAAVNADAAIGSVPLWSSSPEKNSYTPYASQAPAWTGSGFPGTPSCANNTVAWQYLEREVNSGSWPGNAPTVDVDEFDTTYQRLLWGFAFSGSAPEVALNSAGEAQVALVSENGQVSTEECCSGGVWGGWQGLPSAPVPLQPGAVEVNNGDGQFEVLGVATNGQLYDNWQQTAGGSWSTWVAMGGNWQPGIAAAEEAAGDLDVFAVSATGELEYATEAGPGASWSAWTPLVAGESSVAGAPAVGQDADGRLEVFVVGFNNGPLEDFYEMAGGAGWQETSLGGDWPSGDTPAVARDLDGRLEVFLTGSSGQLDNAWQQAPGEPFGGWISLGGSFVGTRDGVVVLLNQNGDLQVFARGADGNLYDGWQQAPGEAFGAWTGLGAPTGGITGGPFAMIWPDGHLEAFVYASSGPVNSLWHTWQTCPEGCGWTGFATLGGAWALPTQGLSPLVSDSVGDPVGALTAGGGQKLIFWQGPSNDNLYEAWYGVGTGLWQEQDLTSVLSIPGTGLLASAPTVDLSPNGGQQLVFWQGANHDLWEAWYTESNGVWQVQDLTSARSLAGSGTVAAAPTVVFTPGGAQQLVFWQGSNHDLWEAWYTMSSGVWQSQDLSAGLLGGGGAGTVASAPGVVVTSGGAQQLAFWEGTNGHLWEAWYTMATGQWQVQDLSAAQFPSAASVSSLPEVILTPGDGGQQLVFYEGAGGGLWEAWYTVVTRQWQAQDLSTAQLGGFGSVASAPVVTVTPGGAQQVVFWGTSSGHLGEAWYTVATGAWASQDLSATQGLPSGAAMTGAPTLMVFPNGNQDVFWEGSANSLWEMYYQGGWSYLDWSAL